MKAARSKSFATAASTCGSTVCGPDVRGQQAHVFGAKNTLSPCEEAAFTENIHRREYIIPTVFRAMIILKIVSRSGHGVTVAEIQEETRFARTTIYRILRTLSFASMLKQDVEGKYWASPAQNAAADDVAASRSR